MRPRPAVYWLFVCIGFTQLGALVLLGESTITLKGLIPIALMVAWLGRRSRAAWMIFVVLNAVEFVATAALVLSTATHASAGAGVLWGDTATILAGSAALLVILFSRPMRAWTRPTSTA